MYPGHNLNEGKEKIAIYVSFDRDKSAVVSHILLSALVVAKN